MTHSRLRLADRCLVIIGGTTGLGLSAARACAAEGALLVLVGRRESSGRAVVEQLKGAAELVVGDAAEPQTAQRAIELCQQRFGDFHGLYHVAGGSGRRAGDGPLDAITDEGWRQTLQQNLDSLFYSNRAAVQALLARQGPSRDRSNSEAPRGGSILNMGSVLAHSPSPRHFATHAYAAAKAAAVGLTRASAAYYAPWNIRFNLLAPGLVETPMSQRATNDPEILRFIAAKQPLEGGRVGIPSDLDAAVLFFLSDESRLVTGQVLDVDGGWSVSEGIPADEPADHRSAREEQQTPED